nr:P-loop containing nucleoside triphosphate hydrolases superfamily protein [Tanacetum cinerariifolium]
EDSVENGKVKKVDESVADKKETRTREEDMAKDVG